LNGKGYFIEIKKEICLHQLFLKLHNYFSTKSPHTSIHFRQSCTSFWNPSFKNFCVFFKQFLTADLPIQHSWSADPSSVPLVLGTGGNHLESDLDYTVDAAALKSPGVELHLLLLHLCEAWRCRVEEVFHFLFQSVRFIFLMQ